ncbi:MAG: hypothetical protein N2Z23_10100 [Pyrinomonadaceae bacterium]|nr:hypothetical protein [Pyrinomonadaceae bacterium]MCX7640776.1 hypothetical protein [Pyrinomonadaceae bacterium]MDW8304671.1 hypothetical protein [Acidobacteriota bacterium]
MTEIQKYEVTNKDIVKDKVLKHLSWTTPFLFSLPPAILLFIVGLFSSNPGSVMFFFLLALISLVAGFFLGLAASFSILYYRSKWLHQLREKIAADGIKPKEIEWFKSELTSAERKALEEIQSKDKVLADAYREMLASRLTASRIIKKAKQQMSELQRRIQKLEFSKSEKAKELIEELKQDKQKLETLKTQAEQTLEEAKLKLQMIEAANYRDQKLADLELNVVKLSAMTSQLPIALEAIRIQEQLRRQLEEETSRLLS